MNIEKQNKLKALIKAELDLCNNEKTPEVCGMAKSPEQYPKLEKMIIDRIRLGNTIGASIVLIEREYNINMNND